MYDILIYIGRFQPVHNAHVETIRRASKLARKVVVIVGSAYQPRTYKNPWSYDERKDMLESCIKLKNVVFEPNIDSIYNEDAWIARVQEIARKHGDGLVGIIGHKKDSSSFYLEKFPQWEFVNVELIEPLNATDIRDLYFRTNTNMNFINGVVPAEVAAYMGSTLGWPHFDAIVREKEFISKYRKQYEHLPYAPVFLTVDAVVTCCGHVLMVKRRSEPGKGLWAMPGGFFNADDPSVEGAMLRELREETGIKVPEPVLRGSIVDQRVFDSIDRSARGRTVTHAYKIALADTVLPRVKGSDDAEKAEWVPISSVVSEMCFEDHFDIISYFVGR